MKIIRYYNELECTFNINLSITRGVLLDRIIHLMSLSKPALNISMASFCLSLGAYPAGAAVAQTTSVFQGFPLPFMSALALQPWRPSLKALMHL